jgi:hypothetical protein
MRKGEYLMTQEELERLANRPIRLTGAIPPKQETYKVINVFRDTSFFMKGDQEEKPREEK